MDTLLLKRACDHCGPHYRFLLCPDRHGNTYTGGRTTAEFLTFGDGISHVRSLVASGLLDESLIAEAFVALEQAKVPTEQQPPKREAVCVCLTENDNAGDWFTP